MASFTWRSATERFACPPAACEWNRRAAARSATNRPALVGPVKIIDHQHRRSVTQVLVDSRKDLVRLGGFAESVSGSVVQVARYIVERTERARSRERVAGTPQDRRILSALLSEQLHERRLAGSRFTRDDDESSLTGLSAAPLRLECGVFAVALEQRHVLDRSEVAAGRIGRNHPICRRRRQRDVNGSVTVMWSTDCRNESIEHDRRPADREARWGL
jgi:hypothetical protein